MHNALDMLNVCIAPTRLCNLRCEHCYIAPELLSDKTMMAESVYREAINKIELLFNADRKVTKINVELLGGELTMMPLSFWERNLPWTLEKMASWDSLYDAEASLIWCTNLIFKDEGYVELLNRMGRKYADGIDIFVPWEPDTNRFKKDFKLLPRYLKTLESISDIKRKTLCVTMSREVINQGPQFLIDTFVSKGITDITCDMLYPSGSGKTYFQRTCTYGQVSDFLIELRQLLPNNVELSPIVEMEAAWKTLTHYHYPGNDSYDYEVEPSGAVTFNSSYTGEESVFPSKPLNVGDINFATKVVFNNSPELRLHHTMPYKACHSCEFAVVCSGGWGWHKQLSSELSGLISHGDCAGLKRVWQFAKDRTGVTLPDRSNYLSMINRRQRQGQLQVRKLIQEQPLSEMHLINESDYADQYEMYFSDLAEPRLIRMIKGALFGKNWVERLFFYDAIGCQLVLSDQWYQTALLDGGEELFRHIVYRNYHFLSFDPIKVATVVMEHPEWRLTHELRSALNDLQAPEQKYIWRGEGRYDELDEFAFLLDQRGYQGIEHAS